MPTNGRIPPSSRAGWHVMCNWNRVPFVLASARRKGIQMIGLAFLLLVAAISALTLGFGDSADGGQAVREVLYWTILGLFMRLQEVAPLYC